MIGDVIYKNHIYFLEHPGHLLNFWTLRGSTNFSKDGVYQGITQLIYAWMNKKG